MKSITIGSDPEFFVLDPKGQPYPATPFSSGTKDNPTPIPELGDGYFELRDNLSFEGNVPPTKTKEEFINNIHNLREYFIRKVSKFKYSISPNGVEVFDKRLLSLPEAQEFGCSSVIDTWSSRLYIQSSRATPNLSMVPYRVSGFHIHIGYDKPIKFESIEERDRLWTNVLIGRLFDFFLTIPSHELKYEPERLHGYGKFGMIRNTKYGLECRTLSTFFTQDQYLGWIWDQLMKIEEFINKAHMSDLKLLSSSSRLVGDTTLSLLRIFLSYFADFKDKDVFSLFNETKNLNYDRINKNKVYGLMQIPISESGYVPLTPIAANKPVPAEV